MHYFDEQLVRNRNGFREIIADVAIPEAPLSSPSRQCPHCARRFGNVQGLEVYQRVHRANPDWHAGVKLRRALVSTGATTVPLPWDGDLLGRCWRMRFAASPALSKGD